MSTSSYATPQLVYTLRTLLLLTVDKGTQALTNSMELIT